MRPPLILAVILLAFAVAAFPLSFSPGSVGTPSSAHASSALAAATPDETAHASHSGHHDHAGAAEVVAAGSVEPQSPDPGTNFSLHSHGLASACCDMGACHAFAWFSTAFGTVQGERYPLLTVELEQRPVSSLIERLERPPRYV